MAHFNRPSLAGVARLAWSAAIDARGLTMIAIAGFKLSGTGSSYTEL